MLNKKGLVFTRARDTISFFVGLLILALGLIPLLNHFKVIGFGLPGFLTTLIASIFIWIIAVAGLYVVIDGFIEPPMHSLHWILIVLGVTFLIVGLIPILHNFNVIPFTILSVLDNLVVYNIVIAVEGLLLLIGGLTEH
jgi:hypothetical protein